MNWLASYRRMMSGAQGRRIAIRRPSEAILQENIRARVQVAGATEVAGGIGSTVYRVIVLAEDVPPQLRPLKQGDQVLVDGRTLTFMTRPDDQTRRDGETLLAYEGEAAGA